LPSVEGLPLPTGGLVSNPPDGSKTA
jgi:hypothetical protein